MPPTISIVAPGNMGAGLAARLKEHGARVLTLTQGRSAATLDRARAAGMQAADEAGICASDIILSVVPPGEAVALARQLAPFIARAEAKPVFVDCNAVSPQTMQDIAQIIEEAGGTCVDGSIIGTPPLPGGPAPALYVSGPEAGRVAILGDHGMDIRVLDAPIGAASTLKMSYAGITKGLTALACTMILAAERAGAGEALHAELARSQKMLLDRFARTVPDMFPKAYRWVAEMEEIAAFLGEDRPESQIYQGIAGLYRRIAEDHAGVGLETETLKAFVETPR
jgi:3-hydroxyisobutyrate dehydrogenase-like beta-hydroxyacid dehydrogenase